MIAKIITTSLLLILMSCDSDYMYYLSPVEEELSDAMQKNNNDLYNKKFQTEPMPLNISMKLLKFDFLKRFSDIEDLKNNLKFEYGVSSKFNFIGNMYSKKSYFEIADHKMKRVFRSTNSGIYLVGIFGAIDLNEFYIGYRDNDIERIKLEKDFQGIFNDQYRDRIQKKYLTYEGETYEVDLLVVRNSCVYIKYLVKLES